MRNAWWLTMLLVVALPVGAQDAPVPQGGDEDELTPEQAMKLLRDAQELMVKSEELLHDSSRGKALETEKDLLKKLEELQKEDPTLLQAEILAKVKKLMERAQKKQEKSLEKLAEIIKKAKG